MSQRHALLLLLLLPLCAGCSSSIDIPFTASADSTWGLGKSRLAKPAARSDGNSKVAALADGDAKPSPGGTETPKDGGPPSSAVGQPVALLPTNEAEKSAGQTASPEAILQAATSVPVTEAIPPAPPPDPLIAMAEGARQMGDSLKAAALYRQYLADHPDNFDGQVGLCHVLVDSATLDEAKPIAADLLKRFPQNERALALAARLDIVVGDLSAAAGHLALAAVRAPANRDVLLVQGFFEDSRGNHALAQRYYRQVLEIEPDPAATNNLAMSMLADGDPAGAARIFEGLMEDQAGASATVRHNLALAYGLLGREGQAARLLAQDLSPAAVESNLKFYRFLRARQKPSTTPDSAAPVPRVAPAASVPASSR